MDSAGAIAGPLPALVLLARYGGQGLRLVFLAAAVPGVVCVLVAVFGIRETGRRRGKQRPEDHPLGTGNVISRPGRAGVKLPGRFYFALVAMTLFSLGNSSDMFLVLRAQSIGIRVALAPLLGLVFNITYTLASWPAGWASDHFSRPGIGAAGYLIFAGVYFAFGQARSTMLIWIAMAVYGLYNALTPPGRKSLVADAVGESGRGRALGLYFFVTSIPPPAPRPLTADLYNHSAPAL